MKVQEQTYKVDIRHTDAALQLDDTNKYFFKKKDAAFAKRWIEKQGFHLYLWGQKDGVTIRLNKSISRPIITVHAHKIIKQYIDEDQVDYPLVDCTCYAAMLLYKRLKENGAIQ